MKKIVLLILCVIMAVALCACAPAQEDVPDVPDVGVPNPVIESSAEEIAEQLGISFDLPAEAEGAVYSIIDMGEDASSIAQVVFTLNGQEFTYRMSSALEYADISGLYYDWANVLAWTVDYCPATVCYNDGEAGYIGWYDVVPGLLYSLAVTEGATPELLTDTAALVFVPAQGNS